MTRKRLAIAVPLALVALLAMFALIGALAGAPQGTSSDSAAGVPAREGLGASGADAKAGAADEAAASDGAVYAAAVPPAAGPASHYLVRTGDLQLLVARHSLQDALRRIVNTTSGMGGYVLSSYVGTGTPPWMPYAEPLYDTPLDGGVPAGAEEPAYEEDGVTSATPGLSRDDMDLWSSDPDGIPYGQVTMRVPSGRFDAAIERFSALGRVEQVSTSSTDVSDQMVDLKARLRHARSVERRLLGFLDQAKTVQAALAVQDRLDQNQLMIEQLEGQISMLSETTSYGTITVSLRERGVPQPGAIDQSDTFGGAFVHSLELIADGARVSAVALGALLPFAALFGALAGAVWYVRRWVLRRRPPRPQALES